MNFNKKLVGLGIMLLAATWIGNIIYYKQQTLKEPIFLKHYYDIPLGMQNMQLYYLDNINSKDRVVNIVFPEVTSYPIEFNESNYGNASPYYAMKRIDINFYRGDIKEIPKEYRNKLITKVQVLFSSGKTSTLDIGKIYLYSDEPEKNMITRMLSGSGGSGGNGSTTKTSFQTNKDITVNGISCRFTELLGDTVKFEINGKPASQLTFPLQLKGGDTFEAAAILDFNKKDNRRSYVYNFIIYVIEKDKEGKESYEHLYINYCPQFPEQFDIKALIKEGA